MGAAVEGLAAGTAMTDTGTTNGHELLLPFELGRRMEGHEVEMRASTLEE
jgi:hypothetical protein